MSKRISYSLRSSIWPANSACKNRVSNCEDRKSNLDDEKSGRGSFL